MLRRPISRLTTAVSAASRLSSALSTCSCWVKPALYRTMGHGLDHVLFLRCEALIELGMGALEWRGRGPGIKEGKINRGPRLNRPAPGRKQPSPANRIQSRRCGEIDVWIKLSLRFLHIVSGCIHLPVGRNDVGATREQVGGPVVGERDPGSLTKRGDG